MPLYLDPSAAVNGSGTEASPFNAPPSNTLTASNQWYLKAGTTLDMGSTTLSLGNSVTVGRYGDGLDPRILSTATAAISCDSTSSAIVIEDICIERNAAVGGTGLQARYMSNANSSLTVRRCLIGGFTTCFMGTRSARVTLDRCMFLGGSTTYGVSAVAQSANNCTDWRITNNTMIDIGIGIYLLVSDASNTAGAFTDLQITGNIINGTASSAIILSTPMSHTISAQTVAVTAPSTITKSTDWPAWTAGQKVFLAGFGNIENFGEFTVASVSTTTLTVVETTLTNESAGTNKGVHLRDAARAFVGVTISGNICTRQGETPLQLTTIRGGLVERNVVTDAYSLTTLSAGIEHINTLDVVTQYNEVRRLEAPNYAVDCMGIFLDGAAENCTARRNIVSDIPGVAGDNSGAALALFMSKDCRLEANIAERCKRGLWVGGIATTGTAIGNVFSANGIGARINSSPEAAAIVLTENLLIGNDVGIDDDADSTVATNAWWQNTTDNANGALASIDATATTDDPMLNDNFYPLPGSPLLTGGVTGIRRDARGVQGFNFIGAYAAASLRTRT